MISLERRDGAFKYLVDTDDSAAKAKSLMLGLDKQEKTIIGIEVLKYTGKERTVIEKESLARKSVEYLQWMDKYEASVYDFERQKNKRQTESLIVECWRSENANRRSGNI